MLEIIKQLSIMKLLERLKSLFKKEEKVVEQKEVKKGLVHYFNRKKGYGFISSKETSKDIFVHCTDMEDNIKRGDRVMFEVASTERGLKAENVQLVNA
jgi:CspA family cold shock protein